MSDTYATSAIVRWDDEGAVTVAWELEGNTYGIRVDQIIFDQMLLDSERIEDQHPDAPVVLQLMVMD